MYTEFNHEPPQNFTESSTINRNLTETFSSIQILVLLNIFIGLISSFKMNDRVS